MDTFLPVDACAFVRRQKSSAKRVTPLPARASEHDENFFGRLLWGTKVSQ